MGTAGSNTTRCSIKIKIEGDLFTILFSVVPYLFKSFVSDLRSNGTICTYNNTRSSRFFYQTINIVLNCSIGTYINKSSPIIIKPAKDTSIAEEFFPFC